MKEIPLRKINNTTKEPSFSGKFNIRKIEDILLGYDMVQELHRHNFYYILALDKAAGEHSIDFVPYTITDHCVFFMRPGQVHDLILKQGSTGYLMTFTHDFYSPVEPDARKVLRSVLDNNFCLIPSKRFSNVLNILDGILSEYSEKTERYLEVIYYSLNIFFVELLRCCSDNGRGLPGKIVHADERLAELLELIRNHFIEHKQVAFYAKQLNLTNYQLNAVTKSKLAKNCSEVITDYVLLEAKRYLLATTNQINQIALYLGYEDVSYFIRFFKKHTGYSPEAFRENFK